MAGGSLHDDFRDRSDEDGQFTDHRIEHSRIEQATTRGRLGGAARSVIRMVSDTESRKCRPAGSPRPSAPSSDIFGSFQGLVTTAMLTRFAIPRLRAH